MVTAIHVACQDLSEIMQSVAQPVKERSRSYSRSSGQLELASWIITRAPASYCVAYVYSELFYGTQLQSAQINPGFCLIIPIPLQRLKQ